MKIAPTKTDGLQKKSAPLLPLVEDVSLYKLDKTNSVTWDLSTVPGTAGAATYKFQCRVLQGDESPRQMLRWRLDVMKVVAGLNVTTLETIRPVHEACMRAGPLASYNQSILGLSTIAYEQALVQAQLTDQANGNNLLTAAVQANGINHYTLVAILQSTLGHTIQALLPRKILAKVKHSMRRDMRKPKEMKVRQYYQNILRMNNEELPNLPPFQPNQILTPDELTDIVLFGTPKSWHNKMD